MKNSIKHSTKQFCETIAIGYTPEYFVVALSSGEQTSTYAITPQHAKRLSQYLAYQLEKYESDHGTIQAQWVPNIVSPVQRLNPPRSGS